MNQLVITHPDGSSSSYPVSDSSVLIIDGQSVALAGVTAVTLTEAESEIPVVAEAPPTEPVEEPKPDETEPPVAVAEPALEPAPEVEAAPQPVAPEAAPEPATPTDPPQPATAPDASQQ
jgi:hypothetical protein